MQCSPRKTEYAVKLLHEYHDVEMPNLGLSKGDVDNILAYLETTASGVVRRSPLRRQPRPQPAAQG